MNNVTIGGYDPVRYKEFADYETIGGGAGASPRREGLDAVHTHMTNTMNTPAEALEMVYPFRLLEHAIRARSGGAGRHRGGDGIVRTYQMLLPATVTLLTERRRRAPWPLAGGRPGLPGRNLLLRAGDGQRTPVASKATLELQAGDCLTIETPGGAGWGAAIPDET